MLTVIFGAGASYDSLDHPFTSEHPYRPPLTTKLFDDNRPGCVELQDQLRFLRPLVPYVRSSPLGLEQALEKWLEDAANPQIAERSLIALRYFIHNQIGQCSARWPRVRNGQTHYSKLLERIERWRVKSRVAVSLITFNYDTLLDDACHDLLALVPRDFRDYIASDEYRLFKPHGSINWCRRLQEPFGISDTSLLYIADEVGRRAGYGIKLSDEYRLVMDGAVSMGGEPLVPAIAVPMQTKVHYEFPLEHHRAMQSCVHDTTKILAIGWRATEHHFLKEWGGYTTSRRFNMTGAIVNPSPDDLVTVRRNLQLEDNKAVVDLPMGFSKFLEGDLLERILNS